MVAHLLFCNRTEPNKKSKRATKPTHQDSTKMDRHSDNGRRSTTGNTGLAKVAVQCSADTFVVNQSLVLRINICGENRHLRQARKRYGQAEQRHSQTTD